MTRNGLLAATVIIAVLGPTGLHHVGRPGRLAAALRSHALVPYADRRGFAGAVAMMVGIVELTVVMATVGAVAGVCEPMVPGVGAFALAIVFTSYLALLLGRRFVGDCGCGPLEGRLSRLSLLPSAVTALAGVLLLTDHAWLDGAVLDHGGRAGSGFVVVICGLCLGAAALLLPASVAGAQPRVGEQDGIPIWPS